LDFSPLGITSVSLVNLQADRIDRPLHLQSALMQNDSVQSAKPQQPNRTPVRKAFRIFLKGIFGVLVTVIALLAALLLTKMSDPSSQQVLGEIESIYKRLPDGRLYMVIQNANHFSFSDQMLLNSQIAIHLLQLARKFGGLDGRRGLAISADYIHTFFDVYLKGAPVASLTSLVRKYPEVRIEP
jgi:hypothetical protein